MCQNSIEVELDKRGGKNFGPPGGKKMTIFMDDLSMPEVTLFMAMGNVCTYSINRRTSSTVLRNEVTDKTWFKIVNIFRRVCVRDLGQNMEIWKREHFCSQSRK